MDTILVVGAESVVGANLAARLSESNRVVALSPAPRIAIAGCEVIDCSSDDPEAARSRMASVRPSRIVLCDDGARSTWQHDDRLVPVPTAINTARMWARVAVEFDSRLTLISSDSVFTGPWMFHTEESDGICPSDPAGILRRIEQDTWQICPEALIVRTHAFGWAPESIGPGWIERTLDALESGAAGPYDYLRHATPMLATDLADVLVRAWEADLVGEFHIAGAERINPGRFVERLADEFQLPGPRNQPSEVLEELPTGFGRGECSLHTGKIRRALGVAMPTISEGLARLREQFEDGYRDQLSIPARPVHEKVA